MMQSSTQNLTLGAAYPNPLTYGDIDHYLSAVEYDTEVSPEELHQQITKAALRFVRSRNIPVDSKIYTKAITFMNSNFCHIKGVENYLAKLLVTKKTLNSLYTAALPEPDALGQWVPCLPDPELLYKQATEPLSPHVWPHPDTLRDIVLHDAVAGQQNSVIRHISWAALNDLSEDDPEITLVLNPESGGIPVVFLPQHTQHRV
ncbi:hypothetical protein GUITHDRAFT_148804 [Guillardia theta CCMP2712]|uniref:Uncharacterized protein n=2 Tax=Guillardia theta (strain CCMP2712) TaxID=905079 RepID=L1I7C6_GUITC|nr:hypothetical protein GUITHDRAFT_148804 [Guillardia theta CCMP2712]EKX32166.1 hypothetical protein GUITHDRAFT_148804 [Guillardia theta CCMP2712]|eukprot:XP_005819146.1 hypothetical protein GUITHDRAFT_148804 [Guillardia theta CCMP2712]